jgi:cation:H+ antiporter
MLIINLIGFIIACIALIASGGFLVKSLSRISKFLRISEFSAAFIIMAIATSLPELFVGISSAMSNNSALSLGNVIGANILNLTLITGIIVLMGKEIKTKKMGKESYFMLLGLALIIILYSIGKSLSRIDGIILLAFFAINLYTVFKKREKPPKKTKKSDGKNNFKFLFIFLISLIILFISSNYVVKYASGLALDLNLSQIIIGLFLISIATTLPELTFGISAVRLKHKEMGIGDQIGTVIANSTLVLGIVAIISPIKVSFSPFLASSVLMFIAAVIFIIFTITDKKLKTIEGVGLILFYVFFVIVQIFIR